MNAKIRLPRYVAVGPHRRNDRTPSDPGILSAPPDGRFGSTQKTSRGYSTAGLIFISGNAFERVAPPVGATTVFLSKGAKRCTGVNRLKTAST
jgi:hypothetical protein